MSKAVETWVWDNSPSTGNDRIVLVYLADQADDDGLNCRPSVERIATKTRIQRGTVLAAIKRLEAAGEIAVRRPETYGKGRFNQYALVLGRPVDDVAALLANGAISIPLARRLPARSEAVTGAIEGGYRRDQGAPDPSLRIDPDTDPTSLAPSAMKKGARLPDPFLVDVAMRAWVSEECPGIDWQDHTRRFADYWRAQPGQRGVKLDWPATWRNWMRRARDDAGRRGRSPRGSDAQAQLRAAWEMEVKNGEAR